MTNLAETAEWKDVYQIEGTDPVEGGAAGVDNRPHLQLANRTAYLKAQVEKVALDLVNIELTPGAKGDTGAKGDQGIQGIQGIQGVKGDKGDQGIQGVKGDQGAQGIQGVKGDTGAKGDPGPQHILAVGLPWDGNAGGGTYVLTIENGILTQTRV